MAESELLSVDAALEAVLAHAAPLGVEDVPLAAASGRYLVEPVVATLDLPPFHNSAMDGYALRHNDTPGVLELIGESAAGAPFTGAVGPGQAVTISTGAVIPAGADAVVPIEWIAPAAQDAVAGGQGSMPAAGGQGSVPAAGDEGSAPETVEVPRQVPRHNAIRHAGSDVAHGTEVLPAGLRIGPAQIGAAASLGVGFLRCGRLPRVAVLTTGSELRGPDEPLGPGQIYDSNGPMLAAALASAGAEPTLVPTAADTRRAHRAAIEQALAHDVVLSTGGVSVGGHDLVREIERELGVRELFWRVALKPGKPLSVGIRERTLVFGIPGNPVSVLVCFELFVRPALAALQGARDPRARFTTVALAAAVERNPERDEMIRVRLTPDGHLEPLRGQQSHQLALSAGADGLARIPRGAGTLPAGSRVGYLSLGAS